MTHREIHRERHRERDKRETESETHRDTYRDKRKEANAWRDRHTHRHIDRGCSVDTRRERGATTLTCNACKHDMYRHQAPTTILKRCRVGHLHVIAFLGRTVFSLMRRTALPTSAGTLSGSSLSARSNAARACETKTEVVVVAAHACQYSRLDEPANTHETHTHTRPPHTEHARPCVCFLQGSTAPPCTLLPPSALSARQRYLFEALETSKAHAHGDTDRRRAGGADAKHGAVAPQSVCVLLLVEVNRSSPCGKHARALQGIVGCLE